MIKVFRRFVVRCTLAGILFLLVTSGSGGRVDSSDPTPDDGVSVGQSDAKGHPTLHVVYRSCSKENNRPRPTYYSKRIALLSCLRSLEQSNACWEVIFLNDGVIRDDLLELMRRYGHVVACDSLGLAGSYRRAVRLAGTKSWAPDDLVYVVEDDYLWRPEAFRQIMAAHAELQGPAYLSSYGTPEERASGARLFLVDQQVWVVADSCTSTMAAERRIWSSDRFMHWLGPWAGGAWDRTLNLTSRGELPYTWSQRFRAEVQPQPLSGTVKHSVKRVGARALLNVLSLGYRLRPRVLYMPLPEQATHLMLPPMLAEGTDWEAVARDTEAWAAKLEV